MSFPLIKKDLINYINANVFINPLNIPIYEKTESTLSGSINFMALEVVQVISEKLDTLMKVPHREFWCHILYDHSILKSLQSFCNNATRPYEISLLEENICQKSENELYKKYYLLILRILSNKETNIPEFSNANFGALLYDNFIVDIPLLFDICSLYGDNNAGVIGKMIMFVFSCQPLYLHDLKSYALQAMKFFDDKLLSAIPSDKAKRNIHTAKNPSLSEEEANNLLQTIIDISHSWHIMLNAIQSQSQVFADLVEIGFHKSVEKLFDKIVPFMQAKIDKFETSEPRKMKRLLSVACYYMISVWRDIFTNRFLRQLRGDCWQYSESASEENFSIVRDCIAMISSCQEQPVFADAIYLMFPVSGDFQLIFDAVKRDKDEYYSDFVKDSVNNILRDIESRQTIFSCKSLIDHESVSLPSTKEFDRTPQHPQDMDLQQILEIYSDLLETDIKAYLKHFSCTAENMLDALLAGAIDTDFVRKTAAEENRQIAIEKASYQLVLTNHRNIYDGDALDTGRVTSGQLHIGKRQMPLTTTVDPVLRSRILDIVVRQEEEEEEAKEAGLYDCSSLSRNLIYEDEQDDVYGISHDGVALDDKYSEESVNIVDKVNRAYRVTNNGLESNGKDSLKNPKGKALTEPKEVDRGAEAVPPTIMEPSDRRFTNYDKRQFKKKRYQDGPAGMANGGMSHRQGSHATKEKTFKKDHRPKGERSKFNGE